MPSANYSMYDGEGAVTNEAARELQWQASHYAAEGGPFAVLSLGRTWRAP